MSTVYLAAVVNVSAVLILTSSATLFTSWFCHRHKFTHYQPPLDEYVLVQLSVAAYFFQFVQLPKKKHVLFLKLLS